jgi:hypothetical protein
VATPSVTGGESETPDRREEERTVETVPATGEPAEGEADGGAPDAGTAGESENEPQTLPLDTVFSLLSNHRRRLVLRHLHSEGETSLGDLAEVIAARENGKPRAEVTATERKRTYVGLYQCHLPKLEDAAVVEADRSRDVRLGPNATQLLAVLEAAEGPESDPEPPSPVPYLAAAVAGLAGAAAWGVGPGAVAPLGTGLLVASLASVALLGTVQWMRTTGGTGAEFDADVQ